MASPRESKWQPTFLEGFPEALTQHSSDDLQVKRGWEFQFAAVPFQIIADPKVSAHELLVYLALSSFTDKARECYPSIPRIAEKARLGETSVKAAIAGLVKKGYVLKTVRRYRFTGPLSNLYTLLADPAPPCKPEADA